MVDCIAVENENRLCSHFTGYYENFNTGNISIFYDKIYPNIAVQLKKRESIERSVYRAILLVKNYKS